MRAAWLEQREEAAARRLALAPLVPCEWLYGAGARLARGARERGWLRRRRLPIGVISVGNLLVGGTGKTPFAAWLAQALHARGRKLALASRGYGRRGSALVEVVSDGRHVRAGLERAGDEPLWLAGRAAGVPVLVGRDRGLVGLRALSGFGAELLLLDDGFQHHRLARDVDLVCFDGAFGLGNGHVLPRGPLREPLSALRRADAIVCLDPPLPPRDEALMRAAAPQARWFAVRRRPASLRALAGGAPGAPESLRGARVGMLCGIARPERLRRSLEALGARVTAERIFPDHHAYAAHDLAGLAAQAPLWITTEKDAVKLLPAWCGRAEVRVLVEALEVEAPGALLDWLEQTLLQRRNLRA